MNSPSPWCTDIAPLKLLKPRARCSRIEIIKHGGGCLSAANNEDKATNLRICPPREQGASGDDAVPSIPVVQTGPTILVAEDDSALRDLICFALEKRNYNVLAAADGVEAIDTFRQYSSQIRLVVADLMMPRMGGFELRRQITALRPDVKFLFMSGAELIVEQHRGTLEGCDFLEKPFSSDLLVKKVSALLAGEAAA